MWSAAKKQLGRSTQNLYTQFLSKTSRPSELFEKIRFILTELARCRTKLSVQSLENNRILKKCVKSGTKPDQIPEKRITGFISIKTNVNLLISYKSFIH